MSCPTFIDIYGGAQGKYARRQRNCMCSTKSVASIRLSHRRVSIEFVSETWLFMVEQVRYNRLSAITIEAGGNLKIIKTEETALQHLEFVDD